MKFVTGKNENIRVIELPDDARPITSADEAILAERQAAEEAKQAEYQAKIEAAQRRHELEVRISELKRMLNRSDYQAIKYAEGEMPEEEYATVKALRVSWRREINELEEQIQEVTYGG